MGHEPQFMPVPRWMVLKLEPKEPENYDEWYEGLQETDELSSFELHYAVQSPEATAHRYKESKEGGSERRVGFLEYNNKIDDADLIPMDISLWDGDTFIETVEVQSPDPDGPLYYYHGDYWADQCFDRVAFGVYQLRPPVELEGLEGLLPGSGHGATYDTFSSRPMWLTDDSWPKSPPPKPPHSYRTTPIPGGTITEFSTTNEPPDPPWVKVLLDTPPVDIPEDLQRLIEDTDA